MIATCACPATYHACQHTVQEAGSAGGAGGVQKSVKTGVTNALLAMLKCIAPEAVPWRKRVSLECMCITLWVSSACNHVTCCYE